MFYIGKKPADAVVHARVANDRDDAQQQSRTRFFWIIDYLADSRHWDFLWSPPPWQEHQRHVWPSRFQSHGGIELVPKAGFVDTNYHPDMVVQRRSAPMYRVDHGNATAPCDHAPEREVRFIGNYLDTLRRVVRTCEHDYIWVTSSLCDYQDFDFGWHPDQWNTELIHVFASNEQKFGDTFYINVSAARQQLFSSQLLKLEWASVKFQSITVPRLPMPQNTHHQSTHVDVVKSHLFVSPFELFCLEPIDPAVIPTLSVWEEQTRTVTPLSKGACALIVPKDVKRYLRDELYDYPYIDTNKKCVADHDIPIVFVSNGEPMADDNWQWLEHVLAKQNRRAIRVQDVKGRVASQHAAARAANHAWYFFVPAKLRVSEDFDWSWQPDRMQKAKHYIFHAQNLQNGLCYGHMATVCYNQELVLASQGIGLDFTMESPHQVVPIISGSVDLASYDDETAWRTAFRETIKILYFHSIRPDIENQLRISAWSGTPGAAGRGAAAGARYFDSVGGDIEQLGQSYEWSWCHQQYLKDQ